MRKLLLISLNIFFNSSHALVIYKQNFCHFTEHIFHEHEHKARYVIDLHNLDDYLPERHTIKRTSIKLLDEHLLPGKNTIKLLYNLIYEKKYQVLNKNASNFFASLAENKPHTYVIVNDMLIFTESTACPSGEILKDKCTKHFLIAGLVKKVNYAGEFYIYKNKVNNEIFVVFDNSSGTYKPPSDILDKLHALLKSNLVGDNLYITTKNYKQKINIEKLFEHQVHPYEFF
jgi:hypothetical protein